MKAWQIPLWGLACLIAAGCRTNPEISALERENRYLEDRIYDLQDDLDRANEDLDKCRRTNQAPPKNAPVSTHIEVGMPKEALPRGQNPKIFDRGTPPPPTSQQPPPESQDEPNGGMAPKFSPGLDPPRRPSPLPGTEPLPKPNGPPPEGTRPGSERRLENAPGGRSADPKTSQSRPDPATMRSMVADGDRPTGATGYPRERDHPSRPDG